MSALCTIMLTCLWLQRTGRVTDEITIEHYHDLGKLMQGFVIFWGYIAFSQFLLIWYANIPEETFWYDLRINQPGWKVLSLILLVGHLFIPFFLLMGRGLRRNRILLTISAVFILCMHWVDHYWLVMPHCEIGGKAFTLSGGGFLAGFSCLVGMIAVYIALFCIVTRWNGFFWAMVLLQSQEKIPLQVFLRHTLAKLSDDDEFAITQLEAAYSAETVTAAIIVCSIIPVLLVYPWIQKYFEKGILLGGVKE